MSTKPPPVPAANRSPKGTGEDKRAPVSTVPDQGGIDTAHQGQQGNSKQNTTNQGYQQDR